MFLVFDTETTGLPVWREPSDHPDQPHPREAHDAFMALIPRATVLIGHNVSFDIRMVRILAARLTGEKWDNPLATYCTMRKSTNICRILSNKPRHAEDWKWPRLAEAVPHFFGEELEDAHRARPDCDAAARIFFHLHNQGIAA